ncbi:helix-turn-helix domain-containing protein [Hymenobacter wooponensis]|uniref:ImmA/IrrE family metallo-endopeptidase n=1 Tax=Hymenobacter wooponensis TaxID=1525360 RepID=A0A4Z0MC07_9BACT|nr:ImmA/IrrE family metallo-endopeptidase [Hymenobacter wooponensis]TGD76910.1 ImmA/IrrE family metallo-endopeptidase [Hymenobacter wooponensis]
MTTFPDRLRAARKMKGWTLQELADQIGSISKQSLNKYEQGLMRPEGALLSLLATTLDVTVDYFFRPNRIELGQVEFRKKAKLSAKDQGIIEEKIKDYLERYLEVEELLEIKHEFNSPFGHDKDGRARRQRVSTYAEVEAAAIETLKAWKLGINPIPNVVEALEENGVCVLVQPASDAFHGLATTVSNMPVIVLNETDTPERRRFTALHELGHLVLDIAVDDPKEQENFCHWFASAMLLPREIVHRMFGTKRSRISMFELIAVKKQYGISVQATMRRLNKLGIVNDSHYKYFCIKIAPNKKEIHLGAYLGETNTSYRFSQLIHRLWAEDIVSDSKAANLAGMTLSELQIQLTGADE